MSSVDARETPVASPTRHTLAPGTLINGRYDVDAVLGEGDLGVVYRVRDRQNPRRRVALRTIRGSSMTASALDAFKAEFKILSELRHPNVASVYDFKLFAGSEDYLFTMELVDGQTIVDACAGKDLTAIVGLVVQVCRALAYLHSRRIVHFDVKPANILIDRSGAVKVLDSGLAGARAGTSVGLFGTPSYMAPELITGGAVVDHRADLYSLGVTIFQLLCGRLPFEATSLMTLLDMQTNSPVAFRESERGSVPAWARALVERLCANDPSARYRSATAVIEAINASSGLSFAIDTPATRESYCFSGKFVGREREHSQLVSFARERLAGTGAAGRPTIAVAGPSGIGKSRLVLELRRETYLLRSTFVETNCYEGSLSEYGPIADAIGCIARLADAASASHLVHKFGPELARLSPDLARAKNIRPARAYANARDDRVDLIERVCEFFVAVSERAPFILCINDLQWARSGTIDVLSDLSRMISTREGSGRRVHIAIVATYGDDETAGRSIERLSTEEGGFHAEFRAQVRSAGARNDEQGELQRITLDPLGVEHLGRLAASMLGIESVPDEFVARVANETAGNPFFVGEVMRALIESGAIYLQSGEWAADRPISALEIPSSMTQVFERRLGRLTEQQRRVLQVMAMYRRPIATSVLSQAAGIEAPELQRILRVLRDRHLAAQSPDAEDAYRTTHDLVREMLQARLSESERRALSRKIAETIEAVYALSIDQHIEALAEHYTAAEVSEKALHYSLAVGERAKQVHAIDVGSRMFSLALELLPPTDSARRLQVSEDLADMRALAGACDDALARYDAILAMLTENVDKARILRKQSGVFCARGSRVEALDLAWRGLNLIGERRPMSRVGRAMSTAMSASTQLWRRTFPNRIREELDAARRALLIEKIESYQAMIDTTLVADPLLLRLCTLRAANLAESLGPSHRSALAEVLPPS